MLFDGYEGNEDDGTVVITGDLGEAFGAESILFRNVRSQQEIQEKIALREKIKNLPQGSAERTKTEDALSGYKAIEGGTLTLKAQSSFILYDF